MAVSLPDALSEFSQVAQKNIEALDAITQSVPNTQTTVQDNINNRATSSITSETGSIFAPVESFVKGASDSFLQGIAGPKTLQQTLQQQSFSSLFGTGFTSGTAVEQYLTNTPTLEDFVPAQQIFQISKNLGTTSMYADPQQAFSQVDVATRNMSNLCREALDITNELLSQTTELLTIQGAMNYSQLVALNEEFFGEAGEKANTAITAFTALDSLLRTRGRYDTALRNEFCEALDDLSNFVLFSNTKFLEFEILRKAIDESIVKLQQILRELVANTEDIVEYVPSYIAATATGLIFNSLQRKVMDKTGVNLNEVLNLINVLTSADSRTQVLSTFDIAGALQAIKAYVCKLDPSVEIQDPTSEFDKFQTDPDGYNDLVQSLNANPLSGFLDSLDASADQFSNTMNAALVRDNSSELSSEVAALGAILTPLALALTNTCGAGAAFSSVFAGLTGSNPDRNVGTDQLFNDLALDQAKKTALTQNLDAFPGIAITDSTTPGQLAQAIADRINELPPGNERDELSILYSGVLARHRATVLSMDFQRREDVNTFVTLDEAEQNRQLVNKTVQTFSGLDDDQFDQVSLQ